MIRVLTALMFPVSFCLSACLPACLPLCLSRVSHCPCIARLQSWVRMCLKRGGPHQAWTYMFTLFLLGLSVCLPGLSVCLPVCLSVCLRVCLPAWLPCSCVSLTLHHKVAVLWNDLSKRKSTWLWAECFILQHVHRTVHSFCSFICPWALSSWHSAPVSARGHFQHDILLLKWCFPWSTAGLWWPVSACWHHTLRFCLRTRRHHLQH